MEKNKRWLVVIDLDGTSLNTDGLTIHKYNKLAFKKTIEQGHIVSICTGRAYGSSKHIYEELQLDTLIGNYNGGIISHPKNDEYEEKHHPIDKSLINKVLKLDILKDSIINFIIEFANRAYKFNEDGHMLDRLTKLSNIKIRPFSSPIDELKIYSNPYSMLIDVKTDKDVTSLFSELVNLIGDDLFVRFWPIELDGSFVIELNPRHSNKFQFVKEAMRYYDIDIKNTIVFGDNDNDLDMLKGSTLGVAMLNSSNNIKFHANDVTKFNNDDAGVGKYLNDHFKLKIK